MPFKPKSEGTGTGFQGYQPFSFIQCEPDETKNFDVFLIFTVLIKNSKYELKETLIGNFDRNADGTIKKCPLLNKINKIFETLGDGGGVNVNGQWVNEKDELIDDIAQYLTLEYAGGTDLQPYLGYFYKSKAKDGKVYNRMVLPFWKNTQDGTKEAEGYIGFMKSKGYLIEHIEGSEVSHSPGTPKTPYTSQF